MTLPSDRIYCCRCNGVARGRAVFLNLKKEIVDNPFCHAHWQEVVVRTLDTVKLMHGKDYDLLGFQIWKVHASPPPLPESEGELKELVADEAMEIL